MTTPPQKLKFGMTTLIVIAGVLVTLTVGWTVFQLRQSHGEREPATKPLTAGPKDPDRSLPEFLELPERAVTAMRLKTAVASVPRYSKVLHMRGSLQIDPNRHSHVHARFPGQVVELAKVEVDQPGESDSANKVFRDLQNFDPITKNSVMAIIWSKDLGEKKSQLADSLARLRLERQTLENYDRLSTKGGISDRDYREQQTKVEQLEITVKTAEFTLRAYQVSEPDIKKVKDAAEKIHRSHTTDKSYDMDWPRVLVTAPLDGIIMEKNVIVGDIVDANADLFKVADTSVLAVFLHAYEEDLASLEHLPKPLRIFIKIPALPELGELEGDIDRFSPMIDPNEHMALLIGTVKNSDGRLRANQFVSADVGIPVDPGLVEIPANALIDVGNESIIYVRVDPAAGKLQRRKVKVIQRYFDKVYIRSELTDAQKKDEGLSELHAGEAVVAGGLLELEDHVQQRN